MNIHTEEKVITEEAYEVVDRQTKSNNKSRKAFIIILITALLLSVAASVTSLCFTVTALSKESEKESVEEEKSEYSCYEDGIVISGEYTILPTDHISSAYLTGDDSGLEKKELEVLKMASDIIDECITDDMSELDKEKAIFDWMTENIGFDNGVLTVIPTTGADSHTPYGVLKTKNAICVGYATTFRLFMEMLEIPCRVVPSYDLVHSWNLVQIEGEWYHTDVYSASEPGDYTYFNICDSMTDYSWETSEFPAADSLKHNLLFADAEELTDIYTLPETIRNALDGGGHSVAFKLPDTTDEHTLAVIDDMLLRMEYTVTEEEEYYDYIISHSWYENDSRYLLAVKIIDYSEEYYDEEETILSEEEEEKILDALENAFGDVVDRESFENIYYDGEYYDDEYYDDEYYDDEYYEDGYYDEEYYDDEFYMYYEEEYAKEE